MFKVDDCRDCRKQVIAKKTTNVRGQPRERNQGSQSHGEGLMKEQFCRMHGNLTDELAPISPARSPTPERDPAPLHSKQPPMRLGCAVDQFCLPPPQLPPTLLLEQPSSRHTLFPHMVPVPLYRRPARYTKVWTCTFRTIAHVETGQNCSLYHWTCRGQKAVERKKHAKTIAYCIPIGNDHRCIHCASPHGQAHKQQH